MIKFTTHIVIPQCIVGEFLTKTTGVFTRGSRGEVMIFFEKYKVLGVEPNRFLNILEGI
jgi:hypothetical protein